MTNQEAIDLINLTLQEHYIVLELQDALSVAIKAMEKQIPKRVIREKWAITKCPCCGGNLGDYLEDGYTEEWDHLKVCDCGQQLDWNYPDDDDNE